MKKTLFVLFISIAFAGSFFLFSADYKTEPVLTVPTEEASLTDQEVLDIEAFAEANNIGYFEAVAIFKIAENSDFTKEELLLLDRETLLDLALDITKEAINLDQIQNELESKSALFESERVAIESLMETYEIPLNQALLIRFLDKNDDTLSQDELVLLNLEALQSLFRDEVEARSQDLEDALAPYLEDAKSRFDELRDRFEAYKESKEPPNEDLDVPSV